MGTDLGFKNIHILVTVIENLLLVKGSSPFLKLHLYFLHWKFDFEINPSVEIECHSNVDFSNLNVWKRTANKIRNFLVNIGLFEELHILSPEIKCMALN